MKNVNAMEVSAVVGTGYLKRSYQKNFLIAELILVMAIGLALAAYALVSSSKESDQPTPWVTDFQPIKLAPPPTIQRPPVVIDHPSPPKPPDIGVIEVVDDSSVAFEFTLATRDELASYNSNLDTGIGDGTLFIEPAADIEEIVPAPDSFVAYDEAPKAIKFPPARYPEIARKAQIEGRVWLKVLVDANGNVQDVIVALPSGTNAGFEESAVAAARDSKWRPAMQNKQPVVVWVSYEVRFKLK